MTCRSLPITVQRSCLRTVIAFLAPALCSPQTSPADPVFRAGVTDAKGSPITGLKQEQFEVHDGGKLRQLSRFVRGNVDVSLVLVVDYSGSMVPRRTALARGVEALVSHLQPGDEAALVEFNEHVTLVQDFHSALKPIDWTVPLMAAKPTGQTALFDAVLAATRKLDSSTHERRVIVILSDGKDTASHASFADALDQVRASNVLLYAVGLFEPGDPDSDASSLRKLADTTGGRVVFDREGLRLADEFTRIVNDFRSRYLLGFYAEGAVTAKPELRKLSVVVHGAPKLRVQARREYRIAGFPASGSTR